MSGITNFAAHAPFLMIVTPLIGAALCWLVAQRGGAVARPMAIANASLTAVLAGVMAWNFSPDSAGPQMTSSILWWQWPLDSSSPASMIRFQFAFGVDGVSLAPLLLVTMVGWFAVVLADRTTPAGKTPGYAGLLLGQALSLSLFAVQDFAAWILCGELWSWWAFFTIGGHGMEDRRQAARRLLLTTSLARMCWMLAGIGMAVCLTWIHAEVRGQSVGVSFLFSDLTGSLPRWISGNETALQLWSAFGPWVLILWFAGLWLMWPVFPAHGGLSGLLWEAGSPLAALCGAILILQGGYVWFRFVAPLLPAGGSLGAMILSACAGFGVLYFGLLAVQQHAWRSLGCTLTLGALQAAWLCCVSGSVAGNLTGWRMVCATCLASAAIWLLIGWREHHGLPGEFDRQTNQATTCPRWFRLIAIAGALLTALPCVSSIAGQAVLSLVELRRRGVPNLTLMAGSVLSAWSLIRMLLQTGFSSPANDVKDIANSVRQPDLRGQDWLLALPVLLTLACVVSPNLWEARLGPTWQRLHDPFSTTVASSESAERLMLTISANKPDAASRTASAEFPWLCAPLFWGLCGALLWGSPRGLLTPAWAKTIAIIGLVGGGAAEWLGGAHLAAVHPHWGIGCLMSLAVICLVELTVDAGPIVNSSARWGGLLLRISGISWSAMSGDLLFAGLAWEVAELGHWCFQASGGELPEKERSREQLRRFLSSLCFWLGIALLATVTQTTHISALSAKLSAMVPRTEDGLVLGPASPAGLAAAILLCSAIGIRCGLLPWSFGRWRMPADERADEGVLDHWLDQLLGLAMLVHLSIALGDGLGGPLAILLALAAAATAIWNALTVVGEPKVAPVLHALTTSQFAGMTLMTAGLMSKPAALSTGIREQLALSSVMPLATHGTVLITGALCGLVVLLRRFGGLDAGALYFDHFRGLFSRRRLDAILLASLLICLTGRGLFIAFLPAWVGLTNLWMTPLPRMHVQISPHPVLMTAAAVCLLAGMPFVGRIADWMCRLAFDPPISFPAPNSNRWQLALACGLTGGVVMGSVCPALVEFLVAACSR